MRSLFILRPTFSFGQQFSIVKSKASRQNYRECSSSAVPAPVTLSFHEYQTKTESEQTNPLVIVHGLFGHKQNWRGVAKALQKELQNRVFVVDMRNHGESARSPDSTYPAMASDLRQFLDKEVFKVSAYNTAFLLGHSMGGKVVAEFAMNKSNSGLVEKMIIEDVAPHRSSRSTTAAFGSYIEAMRAIDLKGKRRDEINRALEASIPDPNVRGFLLTNLYKPRAGPFKWRCNLEALAQNLDHLLGHAVPDGRCEVPTLLMSGAKSNFVTAEDKQPLKRLFPYAQFEEIPSAGHWIHSEQPQRFIDSVSQFLKKGYFTYGDDSFG